MLIHTTQQVDEIIPKLEQAKIIVVDLETTGLRPYLGDRLTGIALYLPETGESWYVTFRHGEGENVPIEDLAKFKAVLSDPTKDYYGYNVKFDVNFLLVDGFPILENRAIYKDVMLALHTLDENRYDLSDKRGLNYKLKDNGRLYLGDEEGAKEDALAEELKRRNLPKGSMWQLPGAIVAPYAEQDVILTWKLWQFFLPYLEKWNQLDYFNMIAEFNSTVLARMEYHGVPVDRDLIQQHIEENKIQVAKDLASLKTKYGEKFNPNSSQQVKAALGTENSRKTTLERLGTIESDEILDYKNLSKAEGTFYSPYLVYSAFDGRIHATFNIGRTTSRRLSSSEPNLQQVPRYSKRYRVKQVFIALPGYKLVEIDYSQQELRLACHFSGQENMSAVYNADGDVHELTASYLFMTNMKELDKQEYDQKRQIGKVANFGFSYGMGVMKAATYIASSLKKALTVDKKFYDDHKEYLPKITLENDTKRPLTWDEFYGTLKKMYAGVMLVEDAKDEERLLPEDIISIYTTTKILFDWKSLYSKFTNGLRAYSNQASTFRNPDGSLATAETGYKYLRLADGCVRHYIRGQRPFTAWNFLIQGTGASIMRQSLLRIDRAFPFPNQEVIPIISVHDSVVLLVKENENFDTNLRIIRDLMEDYDYSPRMKVDIKVGYNWGETSEYHVD